MKTIYQLQNSKNQTMNLDDAYDLVPLLITIGRKTNKEVNGINSQLKLYQGIPNKKEILENKLEDATDKWAEKMKRLGAIPTALLKVKIPTDKGQYVWEFPYDKLEQII